MNVLRINIQAPDAAKQFLESIHNSGFAVIFNHGLEVELIQKNYQDWKRFFDSDEKFKFPLNNEQQTGYVPYRSEYSIDEQDLKNLSEFFNYYPTGIVPNTLKEQTLTMHTALAAAGRKLLNWLDETLPKEITENFSMPLAEMIDDSPKHLLRLIHYPALEGKQIPGEIRTTRHEDSDLITLLPCPTGPGLQVENENGEWQSISYNSEDIVINIGAILQIITKGYLKSTMHRVINPDNKLIQNEARMSMPLFMHPRDEVLIDDNLTAGKFSHDYLVNNGVKQ